MEAILVHLIMLGLLVMTIAGLSFRTGCRADPFDLLVWVMLVILIPLTPLAMASWSEPHFNPIAPIVVGYLTVVWMLACVATVRTVISLSRGRVERRNRSIRASLILLSGALVVMILWLTLRPVTTSRVASRRAQCKNNLKAIGLALHNWHDEHGRFPDVDCAEEGQPPLSWRVAVLPFLDQSALHAQYDPSQSWDAPGNLAVALRDPSWPSLSCPTVDREFRQDDQSRYFTSYVLVTGPQTAFPQGRGLPLDQVTDGLANTMLAAEASGLNIVWTQPRDFDVATQPLGVNLPGDRPGHSPGLLSSPHTAGAHAAFGDGAVRFISEKIDPQVLKALTTATGGEELGDWDE